MIVSDWRMGNSAPAPPDKAEFPLAARTGVFWASLDPTPLEDTMFKKIIIPFLDHFEGYVCQILLAFFVTILFVQIVCRCFGLPLTWSEEVARYAFLWFIMFGACYATRLSALNRVTMHLTKMPKWLATPLLLLGDCFWVAFALAMTYYSCLSIKELIELPYYTPGLDWNLCYIYLIFPFCFFLMAVRIIQVDVCRYILKMEIIDPDKASMEESKKSLLAEEAEEAGTVSAPGESANEGRQA